MLSAFCTRSVVRNFDTAIDDFLEGVPTVSREQVIAFLDEAKESVLARAV